MKAPKLILMRGPKDRMRQPLKIGDRVRLLEGQGVCANIIAFGWFSDSNEVWLDRPIAGKSLFNASDLVKLPKRRSE